MEQQSGTARADSPLLSSEEGTLREIKRKPVGSGTSKTVLKLWEIYRPSGGRRCWLVMSGVDSWYWEVVSLTVLKNGSPYHVLSRGHDLRHTSCNPLTHVSLLLKLYKMGILTAIC